MMASVACIGECMVELRQAQGGASAGQGQGGGLYSRGFGGDTLNTAVYLARLEIKVDYLTALGDDALSDEMIAAWNAEGVGTRRVVRLAGKLPGLYMIQTDAKGERQFFHWRDSAAARHLSAPACSAPASCSTPISARGDGRIAKSLGRLLPRRLRPPTSC